jgi:hypothetical protein
MRSEERSSRSSAEDLRLEDFSVAPDGKESRILICDTWNTDIVPELEP